MENLTGGPPVRYLLCVVPCKLYFPYNEVSSQIPSETRTGHWGKGGSHMIFAAVGGGMIIACGAFVWFILKR